MHDPQPAVLVDPGLVPVTSRGDLSPALLSILRRACAPVAIFALLDRFAPEVRPRIRSTLRDLSDLGLVHLSATHATALHGNGNPYRSTERRERLDIILPARKAAPATVEASERAERAPNLRNGPIGRRMTYWHRVAAMRADGADAPTISRAIGIPAPTIYSWFRLAEKQDGWADPLGAPRSADTEARARAMRRGGAGIMETCRALRIAPNTLRRWEKR